jgi:NAD(P)-dependent dehydrogenase (short-subunit alcohol dehydrogenase family)
VSGSTKGIGFAIAKSLATEGAKVIVNGRTQNSVDQALAELKSALPSGQFQGVAADLSTRDGVDSLVRQVPEAEIVVNNMGIFEPKPFAEITDADWMKFFEAKVMSGVRLSRAYLPGMLKRNWGRIVLISSESGIQIPAEMVHYGMTKTAQLAVSRGLAETVAGTGVTVNSVLPGPTKSEGVEQFVHQLSGGKPFGAFETEFFKTARPTSLLKRFILPEEVANLVAYVCSPLSAATNGAALRVDGGVVRACF